MELSRRQYKILFPEKLATTLCSPCSQLGSRAITPSSMEGWKSEPSCQEVTGSGQVMFSCCLTPALLMKEHTFRVCGIKVLKAWIGFMWLKMGTCVFGFHKIWRGSWLAEQSSASQKDVLFHVVRWLVIPHFYVTVKLQRCVLRHKVVYNQLQLEVKFPKETAEESRYCCVATYRRLYCYHMQMI
jgi:hypothetical protein